MNPVAHVQKNAAVPMSVQVPPARHGEEPHGVLSAVTKYNSHLQWYSIQWYSIMQWFAENQQPVI